MKNARASHAVEGAGVLQCPRARFLWYPCRTPEVISKPFWCLGVRRGFCKTHPCSAQWWLFLRVQHLHLTCVRKVEGIHWQKNWFNSNTCTAFSISNATYCVFQKIASTIELKAEDNDWVNVVFRSRCKNKNGPLEDTSVCEDLGIGANVTFEVYVYMTLYHITIRDDL